jgi:hypothetical protein
MRVARVAVTFLMPMSRMMLMRLVRMFVFAAVSLRFRMFLLAM